MAAKASGLWNHFRREDSTKDSKAVCIVKVDGTTICNAKIPRKGGNSSGMRQHLEKKHQTIFSEFLQKEKNEKERKELNIAETPLDKEKQKLKNQRIDLAFEGMKIWDINHPKSKMMDRRVLEMIVMDGEPFDIVNHFGFQRLIHTSSPQYELKSRPFYSDNLLLSMNDSVVKRVSCLVANADFVSFTTDAWSSRTEALLSLTAHWITDKFERVRTVLGAAPLEHSHTSEYLSEVLLGMISRWSIDDSKIVLILRDAGANIKRCLFDTGFDSLDCSAHKLALCVKEGVISQPLVVNIRAKCRKMCGHFAHSVTAKKKLTELQKAMGYPEHSLIQEIDTRWNSTLHMFERAVEQQPPLAAYSAQENKLELPTPHEWNVIKRCIPLLKPFDEMTLDLSKNSTSISFIIPMVKLLLAHLASPDLDKTSIQTLHNTLQQQVETRFHRVESQKALMLATVLDPRYKLDVFESKTIKKDALDYLKDEAENKSTNNKFHTDQAPAGASDEESGAETECVPTPVEHVEDEGEPVEKEPRLASDVSKERMDNLWDGVMGSQAKSTTNTTPPSTIKQEFENYLRESKLERNRDPLKWWKRFARHFPQLSKLAKKYLCSPPTSVPSEQLFSRAGDLYEPKRSSLGAEKAEMLLFLRANLPLIEFDYEI